MKSNHNLGNISMTFVYIRTNPKHLEALTLKPSIGNLNFFTQVRIGKSFELSEPTNIQ